jgi:hypothetical protein
MMALAHFDDDCARLADSVPFGGAAATAAAASVTQ